MAHSFHLAALVGMALAGTLPVGAQISTESFPAEPGNRWQYEVEGTYLTRSTEPRADTIDALVEWRIKAVPRPDSVVVHVERRHAARPADSATCAIWMPHGYAVLGPVGDDPGDVCGPISGLPTELYRSTWSGSAAPASASATTVEIGGQSYPAEAGVFVWSNSHCIDARCLSMWGYQAAYDRALGIGTLASLATFYSPPDAPWGARRDTLTTTLVGAEVGGTTYGSLGAVAMEGPEGGGSLTVRVGPNPTRGAALVWISSASLGEAMLTVLDVRGRVVGEQTVRGSRASVSGLAPGIYVVRVVAGGAVAQSRLVVAR